MRNFKTFLTNLSNSPGVYQMLGDEGEVLYVGKAKNLKKRITSYFNGLSKDQKTLTLINHIRDIDITVTHSENEAVLLECNLIKKYRPRYNVVLRDDKSYPYIFINTKQAFPSVDLYRGPRKKNGLYFGPYPSAFAVRDTISLLQKLFGIRSCHDHYFEARTRPCLLYQIGRCSGSCVGLITKEEYAKNIQLAILFLEGKSNKVIDEMHKRMEQAVGELHFELAAHYRDQIARLRQIQERQYINVHEGNADIAGLAIQAGIICIQLFSIRGGQILGSRSYFPTVPANSSNDEIIHAFITQHYLSNNILAENIPKQIIMNANIPDKALMQNVLTLQAKHKVELIHPIRGEKKKWIAMATTSAKQSLHAHLLGKTNIKERIESLHQALNLKQLPQRIECFDISHTMGEATVASCVVFDQTGPLKRDYRRFNIKDIAPGDDIAAMRQVIARRFKRLQKEEAILPNAVLIDGGKAQLSAVQNVMNELGIHHIDLVAVSKGPERKPGFETLHMSNGRMLHLPADSLALHFIQQIRDEAHRFAVTGHRQRRDKTRRISTLELIPGIGSKRRRELLRYFGGIQGLAHASLDEIKKVPGISRSLAERIFAALHDATI